MQGIAWQGGFRHVLLAYPQLIPPSTTLCAAIVAGLDYEKPLHRWGSTTLNRSDL